MSQRTVHDCDVCGKLAKPRLHAQFVIGSYLDAAGSTDMDVVLVDLCLGCAQGALLGWAETMTRDEARGWVKRHVKSARDYKGRPL